MIYFFSGTCPLYHLITSSQTEHPSPAKKPRTCTLTEDIHGLFILENTEREHFLIPKGKTIITINFIEAVLKTLTNALCNYKFLP